MMLLFRFCDVLSRAHCTREDAVSAPRTEGHRIHPFSEVMVSVRCGGPHFFPTFRPDVFGLLPRTFTSHTVVVAHILNRSSVDRRL
jgi:hypothetical protein